MKNLLIIVLIFSLLGCSTTARTDFDIDPQQVTKLKNQIHKSNSINRVEVDFNNNEFEDITLMDLELPLPLSNKPYISRESNDDNQYLGIIEPIKEANNTLKFHYGRSNPQLICAKLRVCTIELQAGEKIINEIHSGDNERWNISVSYTGTVENAKPLVMVKPFFSGVETNLVIPTDRRVYNILVKSIKEGEYSPRIRFYYPKSKIRSVNLNNPAFLKTGTFKKKPASTAITVDQINFGYSIKGNKKLVWFPSKVFDDGRKVFIQFTDKVKNSEIPVLLGVKNGKHQILNLRYRHPYYIVDHLFDECVLRLGKKEKVIISRK